MEMKKGKVQQFSGVEEIQLCKTIDISGLKNRRKPPEIYRFFFSVPGYGLHGVVFVWYCLFGAIHHPWSGGGICWGNGWGWESFFGWAQWAETVGWMSWMSWTVLLPFFGMASIGLFAKAIPFLLVLVSVWKHRVTTATIFGLTLTSGEQIFKGCSSFCRAGVWNSGRPNFFGLGMRWFSICQVDRTGKTPELWFKC